LLKTLKFACQEECVENGFVQSEAAPCLVSENVFYLVLVDDALLYSPPTIDIDKKLD